MKQRRQYRAEWHQANKERIARHRRKYYQANRERIAKQMHEYYLRNKEAYFQRAKKSREKLRPWDDGVANAALMEYDLTGHLQSLITQPK